jgi:hypothetical protein
MGGHVANRWEEDAHWDNVPIDGDVVEKEDERMLNGPAEEEEKHAVDDDDDFEVHEVADATVTHKTLPEEEATPPSRSACLLHSLALAWFLSLSVLLHLFPRVTPDTPGALVLAVSLPRRLRFRNLAAAPSKLRLLLRLLSPRGRQTSLVLCLRT